MSGISVIGVPMEAGAGRQGCRMGPDALRIAGITESLRDCGAEVADLGNVAPVAATVTLAGQARGASEIAGWARAIMAAAAPVFGAGRIPVFLGGDHSLSIGSAAAALHQAARAGRKLHVLWLDAHADFNTPATSPSGNMHGMPCAFLCGEAGFAGLLDGVPVLPPSRLHVFGARSIDGGERSLLAARGVDVCDMRLIDEHGVKSLMRTILDGIAAEGGDLHVSLDVDFLDPAIAPGVGTTVPGGATFREAHLVMELIHESGLMRSIDLVELNPYLDNKGKSARLLVDLVSSAFGRSIFDRRTPAG
jgi:arginase